MSSSKQFVVPVKPRDTLLDTSDLSLEAAGALFRFWMLHEMHREPLPPREEKLSKDAWDEWFRDKLFLKNVRTWRRVRDELLEKAKIRRADDGRLYIGRTMRAVEEKRGGDPARWGGESDQGSLLLEGVHAAQRRDELPHDRVEKPVDVPGELRQSGDVRPKIERTSGDVWPNWRTNPLIYNGTRPALSYSKSQSPHEVVVVIPFAAARARGDPTALRA